MYETLPPLFPIQSHASQNEYYPHTHTHTQTSVMIAHDTDRDTKTATACAKTSQRFQYFESIESDAGTVKITNIHDRAHQLNRIALI